MVFEGAEEDGDSVAETDFPGILTFIIDIYQSTSIYAIVDQFSWVRNIQQKCIHLKNFCAYGVYFTIVYMCCTLYLKLPYYNHYRHCKVYKSVRGIGTYVVKSRDTIIAR